MDPDTLNRRHFLAMAGAAAAGATASPSSGVAEDKADPFAMAHYLDEKMADAGVDVLLLTQAVDVRVADGRITHVVIFNKGGLAAAPGLGQGNLLSIPKPRSYNRAFFIPSATFFNRPPPRFSAGVYRCSAAPREKRGHH